MCTCCCAVVTEHGVCSLVADKLRVQDIDGAGEALSCALFVGTMFGLIIQITLMVQLPHYLCSQKPLRYSVANLYV